MTRRLARWSIALAVLASSAPGSAMQERTLESIGREMKSSDPKIRRALFELLQPVTLTNCALERFGEANDGGYLMCSNLLGDAQSGYSYGISGYDKWGCDISTKLAIRLHQYDCFNTTAPACPTGDTVFHAECVAETTKTEERRFFDTMEHQFARNGDATKRLVIKMDVEGAEWDSLLHASDDTLARIDQLAIEFHFVHEEKFVKVVQRLKQFFHLAHVHFNNFSCVEGIEPFPAWAYEALLVNKRIGLVDPAGKPQDVHPSAAPNTPTLPDCQVKTP